MRENLMDKEKIKKIMERTCFKSISYCCGLDKFCDVREGVLAELGISKEEFVELKNKSDEELFKLLKKKD
jgi:predicted metal-binding transcription factor (methanogenesis marker protein 9)